MVDMRRRGPEPAPGFPRVEHRPGLADQTMRELAPFLAEEGVDLDDVPDLETLQAAMGRAVTRMNQARFTPTGPAREAAAATLRRVVEALAAGDTALAGQVLEHVPPDAPEGGATVAGCTGVALMLLDAWLSGAAPSAPAGLGQRVRVPTGHWAGGRAATDVLVLAARRRAFASLDSLTIRQGGKNLLYGAALALAAATQTWSSMSGDDVHDLAALFIA